MKTFFKKLTDRLKSVNNESSFYKKNIEMLPFWSSMEIDISSYCNRDCEFCPRYNDRSGVRKDAFGRRIRKRMSTEKIFDLIDQANDLGYTGKIKLHRLSEPLLDPRYLDFAKYIKENTEMKLFDDTNGDVLRRRPDLISKLDGVVYGLCIGLYDAKNDKEKKKEIDYFNSAFDKTRIRFSIPQDACIIRQNSKIFEDAEKHTSALKYPCRQPQDYLHIRYDGYVSLCCEDDQCNFDLGNVFEKSIEEIWWSEKHVKLAEELSKEGGRYKFDLCKNCYNSQEMIML